MGNNPHTGVQERVLAKRDGVLDEELKMLNTLKARLQLKDDKIQQISNLTASEAAHKLNSGAVTSQELVAALALRTASVGKRLCLFTQTMFEPAIKMAEKCDKERKGRKNWTITDGEFNEKTHLPPLYGIPISVKDTYDMAGYSSTVGLLSRAEKQFKESPIITALKNSGAIPFVRSNMPQIGMSTESMNNLWGRSLNPWDNLRGPGGSSGGQGGLVSARCSMLGLGSDIGGSVRIPAEFCGIYGLKCTAARFSANYHTKFCDAFSGSASIIPLCLGPLARSTEDLALWMKVATSPAFYDRMDPYIQNIPFDSQKYLKASNPQSKLKIGVFRRLTDVEPTKASARALQEIVNLLISEGHQVVDITIPNEREAMREFYIQNLGPQGVSYREMLAGEKPCKEYESLFQAAEMWSVTRSVATLGASLMMPRIHYYLLEKSKGMSAYDYQAHAGRIFQYRKEWINYWQDQKLDYVVTIGFGSQALLHGNSELTSLAAGYTFLWNVLEMCVGAMPVTTVQQGEQEYETEFNDPCARQLKQNAKGSAGLPAGIQVVGLPYQEERVLGLMKFLESKLAFYDKNPLPKV